MADGRRVLITGIAGQLAGLLARTLEERDDVETVLGLDTRDPRDDLRRTEVVRADLGDPVVLRLLRGAEVDTVVHMATTSTPVAAGGRARMKELNVIGTMQLLAACQKAPSLRRLVLKSSAAVYGSSHDDPALFGEDDQPRIAPTHGFAKDAIEVEGYTRGFARRRADVDVTVLRFANFLGGEVVGAFDGLFSLPVVPRVLGFDPRFQFVHAEDGVGVLVHAATGDHAGIFNVAGPGVLYLSQCARIAGLPTAPVPPRFVPAVIAALRRGHRADVESSQLRFFQFGRGIDTTRLVEELGYTPRWTTRAAFEDYVAAHVRRDDVRARREVAVR